MAGLFRGEIDYGKAAALAVGVRALDPPDGCQDAVTGEQVTPDGLRRGLVAAVEAAVLRACQLFCVSGLLLWSVDVGGEAVGVGDGECAEGGLPAVDDLSLDELAVGLALIAG